MAPDVAKQVNIMWFDVEDARLDRIVCDRRFWKELTYHLFFPLVLAQKYVVYLKNMESLKADKKLAEIWSRKLFSFAAAWLCFVFTIAVWKLSGKDVGNMGSNLLRNIAMVMPIVGVILFYSAVPVLDSALQNIIFQRQLAVPPTLLLQDDVHNRYAKDGYLHEKLTKVSRGFKSYEQWEEAFEESAIFDVHLARPSQAVRAMIGEVSDESRERIRRWVEDVQSKARAGRVWKAAWQGIHVVTALHIGLPSVIALMDMREGLIPPVALVLSLIQSGVSGYCAWIHLRLALLAVLHSSRLKSLAAGVTDIIGGRLKCGRVSAGEEALCEGTVRDWFRLKMLLHVEGIRQRDMLPLALDSLAFTSLLLAVMLFSLLANMQEQKQVRAVTARQMEVFVWAAAVPDPSLSAGLDVLQRQLEVNRHVHKLFGLMPIDTGLIVKLCGLLAGGPISMLIRLIRDLEV